MKISRVWAMQRRDTFDCPPIRDLIHHYLKSSKVSVDPFARNKRWATYTNDLDQSTAAESHLDARDFLSYLVNQQRVADLIIIDPPYSQVQVSRSYKQVGREYKPFGDDNNAVLYRQVRNLANILLDINGIVISLGWNSTGMGKKRGYVIDELLLVCHGGAHNDTIVTVERKVQSSCFSSWGTPKGG